MRCVSNLETSPNLFLFLAFVAYFLAFVGIMVVGSFVQLLYSSFVQLPLITFYDCHFVLCFENA
jgi:hypothetical protein